MISHLYSNIDFSVSTNDLNSRHRCEILFDIRPYRYPSYPVCFTSSRPTLDSVFERITALRRGSVCVLSFRVSVWSARTKLTAFMLVCLSVVESFAHWLGNERGARKRSPALNYLDR